MQGEPKNSSGEQKTSSRVQNSSKSNIDYCDIPKKRYKPNINGARSRISFDGSDEAFREDSRSSRLISTDGKANEIRFQKSQFSKPTNETSDCALIQPENSSEGQGESCVSEEDADEEGKPPSGDSQKFLDSKGILPLQPTLSTISTSSSTTSSPLLESAIGGEITRDLWLAKEDVNDSLSDTATVIAKLNSKVLSKLNQKYDSKQSDLTINEIQIKAQSKEFSYCPLRLILSGPILTFKCPGNHIFSLSDLHSLKQEKNQMPQMSKRSLIVA